MLLSERPDRCVWGTALYRTNAERLYRFIPPGRIDKTQ